MRRTWFAFAIGAFALFAALTAVAEDKKPEPSQTPAPSTVEKIGTLGLIGNEPFIKISFIEEGTNATFVLTGYWTEEMKALGGVKVKVRGVPEPAPQVVDVPQLQSIGVIEYEIMDVGGGVKPFVGVLKLENKELLLVVRDLPEPLKVKVSGTVKEQLESNAGAKVWIAGKLTTPNTLRPTRFQVIKKVTPPSDGAMS